MNIAIIKSGVCVNTCLFADLQTAQTFLTAGVWSGADAVLELPDGYGIGDSYDAATNSWTKAAVPEAPERPDTQLDANNYILDLDYRLTLLEITNGGNI